MEVKDDKKNDKTEGKRFGFKPTIASGLAVASVAALLLMGKCMTEPPRPCPPCATCPPAVAAPVKGDGRCEIEKGEHDPSSPNWDPASCGFCGDGTHENQTWETIENCPVDFTCGNGRVE